MKTIALGIALLAGAVAPAMAGPLPNGGATAQEVAAVLQKKGYPTDILLDKVGDPMVKSAREGTNFSVLFYGCKGPEALTKRCTSIQFSAAWDMTDGMELERINRWNAEKRFGRAFLDEVKDPFVQMDVDLERGSTTESVDNNIDTWAAVLTEFRKMIGE